MALVLSRKEKEAITIGENVTVTVLAIHGDRVKLGIEAPGATSVHRTEVWRAIQGEQEN